MYTDFDDDDYIIIVMVWCSHGRRHGYLHGKWECDTLWHALKAEYRITGRVAAEGLAGGKE